MRDIQFSRLDTFQAICDKSSEWLALRLAGRQREIADLLTADGRPTSERAAYSWMELRSSAVRWSVNGRCSPLALWLTFLRAVTRIDPDTADELVAVSRQMVDSTANRRRDLMAELAEAEQGLKEALRALRGYRNEFSDSGGGLRSGVELGELASHETSGSYRETAR